MLNQQLIDILLFVITVIASFAYVYNIQKKRLLYLFREVTFCLVFLTLYTLLNVCAHLIAVITVAIIKANAGTFAYDLRFYTLIQFGVLLAILNFYLLSKITRLCQGSWQNYSGIYYAGALQIIITLPLVPFNPISLLPSLTAFSLMLLVYKASRRQVQPGPLNTEIPKPELVLTSV